MSVIPNLVPAVPADYLSPAEHIVRIVGRYRDREDRIVDPVFGYEPNQAAELVDTRWAACVAILSAKGRCGEFLAAAMRIVDRYTEKLSTCGCGAFPASEFHARELGHALLHLRDRVEPARWETWLRRFARPIGEIHPSIRGHDRIHNANTFALVGEQIKARLGIPLDSIYLDRHLAMQWEFFDANGMYRDPKEPMTYDAVTRANLALIVHHGYAGSELGWMSDVLARGAWAGLLEQSTTGEAPYGGRSNQFHFVEATHAQCFEHQARAAEAAGERDLARLYRGAAVRAIASTLRWIHAEPMRHQKSFFPAGTHGVDSGGTYVMYAITAAMLLCYADLEADPRIEPGYPESWPHVFVTGPDFHKVFLRCDPYFVEIDTAADPHKDATGLGRFHHRDAPTELGPSMPAAPAPEYSVFPKGEFVPAAVAPAVGAGERWYSIVDQPQTACRVEAQASVRSHECTCRLVWPIATGEGAARVVQELDLSADGLALRTVDAGGERPLRVYWPILVTNGRDFARVRAGPSAVRVGLAGWELVLEAGPETTVHIDERLAVNRNGVYRLAAFEGKAPSVRARFVTRS